MIRSRTTPTRRKSAGPALPRRMERSGVGRADLVRLRATWGSVPASIRDEGFQAAAAVLGFRPRPADERGPASAGQSPPKRPPGNEPAEQPPPTVEYQIGVLPPATFFYLSRRERITPDAGDEARLDPDWLDGARVLQADQVEDPDVRPPRKPPLAAWPRLWPVLRAVLGDLARGREPDVRRVVQWLGAGRALRRVPMLPRRRWHCDARLLADFASRSTPFHHDYNLLRDALVQLRGRAGLVLDVLESEPGRAPLVRRAGAETAPYAWQPPPSDAPLLVLSDLGLYDTSGPALDGWLAFGRRLRVLGLSAAVLCPVPAAKIPNSLRRLYRVYAWDRNSGLRALAADRQGSARARPDVFDRVTHDAALTLLGLSAPALVAEPADVRAMRHLLPPGSATVAVEALLWRPETGAVATAVKQPPDAWGSGDRAPAQSCQGLRPGSLHHGYSHLAGAAAQVRQRIRCCASPARDRAAAAPSRLLAGVDAPRRVRRHRSAPAGGR